MRVLKYFTGNSIGKLFIQIDQVLLRVEQILRQDADDSRRQRYSLFHNDLSNSHSGESIILKTMKGSYDPESGSQFQKSFFNCNS